MKTKNKLSEEVWSSDKYYRQAKKGSQDINHPGIKVLQRLSKPARNILDLGCGEGTRLNLLLKNNATGTGIDLSEKALEKGKKSYPKIKFINADLETIPLKDGNFDLVYSAYVFEHLNNPEKVLDEAIRFMSEEGYLVLIAPNYGAPNRVSPPFKGSRINKFIQGVITDFRNLFTINRLGWNSVEPIANKDRYEMDWDTTVEPYIGSLIKYLEYKGLLIKEASSCWSEELAGAKIHQKIFKILGGMGLYPFWMWGPHLVVVARKGKDGQW